MFPNAAVTFNEARYVCQENGGDLARVKTREVLDTIIELVEDKFEYDDFFKADYWLGIIRPDADTFYWAHDCSIEKNMSLVDDDYNENELCYRFKKDIHDSERKNCDSDNAFLCEIYSNNPCSFATRLHSSALVSNVSTLACENACNNNYYCWGTVKVETNKACVLLMDDNQGSDVVDLTSKFCIDVAINTSSTDPPDDHSPTPNHSCNSTGSTTNGTPTSNTSIPTMSSTICPTVTVAPSPSYITNTLSVTINHTLTSVAYSTIYHTTTTALVNNITVTSICPTDTVIVTSTPAAVTDTIIVTVTPTPVSVTVTATQSVSCSNVVTPPVPSSIPADVIASITKALVANLTVDVTQTSAHLRSLTSAQDYRASSQYIGYMGVLLIAVPMAIIVLSDCVKIVSDFRSPPLKKVVSK
ncbi:hypothetical protein ACF0H5_013138 [Mactra antiquata]